MHCNKAIMRAADLFCGCGGLTIGAQSVGIDVVIGVDNNKKILDVYKANQTHDAILHDLSDVDATVRLLSSYNVNMIIGSPPCTDFSSCGNMQEGLVASLTISYCRVITKLKPRIFVMENVPRLAVSRVFDEMICVLKEAGYSFTSLNINAKYCGVGQSRQRLFVCGSLGLSESCMRLQDMVKLEQKNGKATSVRDVIPGCEDAIYFAPRNGFHPCVLSTDAPYPTLRSSRGKCMERPNDRYERRVEDVAPVEEARVLSISDVSAISSFPSNFKWPESRSLTGVMVGNCVPPKMAQYVFERVMATIGKDEPVDKSCGTFVSHRTRERSQQPSYLEKVVHKLTESPDEAGIVVGTYIAGREELYEMRYTFGTTADGDQAITHMLRWKPQNGWLILVRERHTKTTKVDDFYIGVPGYKSLFRGHRLLKSLGLL